MYEAFYKITSEKFIKAEQEYQSKKKQFMKVFDRLAEEFGIETDEVYLTIVEFEIVPTKNDREKFKEQFKKDTSTFKRNSKVGKRFKELIEEQQIQRFHRPKLWDYVNTPYGRRSSRYTEIDGVYYGTLGTEEAIKKQVEGFEEMKASVFYKIIEDYNERVKVEEDKND